jgi:hypothetical protein
MMLEDDDDDDASALAGASAVGCALLLVRGRQTPTKQQQIQ